MAERYNFKYLPLVGKLPGKSMVEQTETAINELASVVYDNVGHVGNLAEEVKTANTNASNALDKAAEALETSSRVYIKQIAAVDVNDYYDSELYYINNDGSTNIPVRDRGFLEVKTNDDKTACEQVFIADSTGTPYYRHGRITEQTLGEETTYVVTWSSWYRVATTEYVQAELQDYLPLSGGNITGDLSVTGTITGNVTGNVTGNADTATNATNATNDANGSPIAGTYLPLAGGSITGDVDITGDLSVSGAIYSSDPASGENSGQVPTTAWVQKLVAEALKLGVLPGTVTAFSGTFKDGYPVNKNTGLVDKEWHLCDGTNGTPDLRNRFIYGGNGTNNGNTGGEKSVTLSMEQIPKHYFSGTTSTGGKHNHSFSSARDTSHTDRNTTRFEDTGDFDRTRAWLKNDYTENAGEHNHTFTTNTLGGGQPHNNMPPYYVLAYIMRL